MVLKNSTPRQPVGMARHRPLDSRRNPFPPILPAGHGLSLFRLRCINRHLRQGGLIAYPTEGVYGLGCDPLQAVAVSRILALKGRAASKGFIVIAATFDQVKPWLAPLDESVQARLMASWPGPKTWIIPAAGWMPGWLSGGRSSLAVRVSAHPVVRALCLAFGGPLVSTSANKSGRLPARHPMQIIRFCRQNPALLRVPGMLGGLRKPTPIHDALTGRALR
jgi:L-threonylcarbamoyladenylate synthase